jgi:hypothetical protein
MTLPNKLAPPIHDSGLVQVKHVPFVAVMRRLVFNKWTGADAVLVICLCFAAGSLSVGRGTDFSAYQNWSSAFVAADIHQLSNGSETTGNNGLPFEQRSPGPGQFMALATIFRIPMTIATCAAFAIFWFGWIRLAFHELHSSLNVLVATAMLFVSTGVGVESLSLDSELIALFAFGFLLFAESMLKAEQQSRLKSTDKISLGAKQTLLIAASIGSATAILALTRFYLVIYSLPAVLSLLQRLNWKQFPLFAIASGIPVVIAGWQLAEINFWHTGHYFQSPYSFGDEHFRSLDLSMPYLGSVLLDVQHGLISRHPIFALTPFAFAVCCRENALFWLSRLLPILINLWLASGWFFWTFAEGCGNRGMTLAGPYVILAVARTCNVMQASQRQLLIMLTMAMTTWSFLLFQQGVQSANDLGEQFSEMLQETTYWLQPDRVALVAFAMILAWSLVRDLRFIAVFTLLVSSTQFLPSQYWNDPVVTASLFAVATVASRVSTTVNRLAWNLPVAIFSLMIVVFIPLKENTSKVLVKHPDPQRVVTSWSHVRSFSYWIRGNRPTLEWQADKLDAFLVRMQKRGYVD